ncbi:MAG TPA: (d)CMP kinase [Chloroflexota bacterium]|nr:(d)CMP kinase [Chloroflexota bacterium]
MRHPIIAIDGPAAVGKTTVGRRLAERLGWTFLDTGVLYRALAWRALQDGVAPNDEARLAAMARGLEVQVSRPTIADGRDADLRLGGRDITWEIRAPAVDRIVSIVAALPAVRAALVPAQRRAAAAGPAVVVGRDIGTVIFPDAALKVFLLARPEERARRRARDLAARGAPSEPTAVLADLQRRDALDSGRAHAPLAAAPDAVSIDTEGRSVDEVVAAVLRLWQARHAGAG